MTRSHTRSVIALVAGSTLAVTAFAQPANDSMSSPIVLSVPGLISGSTAEATNEFGLAGLCGNGASSKDVWYRFDCTTSATVEFATCSGTTFNTILQAFSVHPVSGGIDQNLACNDNACGTWSRISLNAVAGQRYLIRVCGSGTASGSFTLTSTVPIPRTAGPDVTVGDCADIQMFGTGSAWMADNNSAGNVTGMRAYAIGTNSWNLGNIPVEWQASNQFHPVIGQQMYRYKGGTFEQIGISWLKHGFLSTNSSDFPEFGACDSPPNGGAQLGVNCSDLYGSGLNGGRSYLGPRFDVKPITGQYTYPWEGIVGTYTNTDQVARRLVVRDVDVAAASNPGAEYYGDTQYVTQDDAQWNNSRNNLSARKINTSNVQTNPSFNGQTVRRTTALELWAMEKSGVDTGINLTNLNFHERSMNVTNKWTPWTSSNPNAALLPAGQWTTFTSEIQGRYILANRVTQNADTTWNYDYMVMNVNSDRAGGSFAVRLPAGATVTDVDFHAPLYHSGERTLNNPWLNNAGAEGKMMWTVDPSTRQYHVPGLGAAASTVTFNPNALMWGTMYNFRFKSSAAPVMGSARLGLFRAPADNTGFQGSSLAVDGLKVPAYCVADVGSQGGVAGPDGRLDNDDFIMFIDAFFNSDMLMADIGKAGGLPGADNVLDNNDFIAYIDAFFNGCGN